MICILIALAIVMAYISVMIAKIGRVPESVSETYYLGGGVWFIFVMMVSGILVSAGLLDMSEGSDWQFVSFFSGAGMCFVGASPLFKNEGMERIVHFTGAWTLVVCSQLWIILFSNPIVLLFWLNAIISLRSTKYMFWLEMTAMATLSLAMCFV